MAKKFELQSWFENTWKHYNDTLSEYLKMTKERKKNYDKIKDYDSQMRKLMDSQVRQIGELYVSNFKIPRFCNYYYNHL